MTFHSFLSPDERATLERALVLLQNRPKVITTDNFGVDTVDVQGLLCKLVELELRRD